MNWNDYQQQAMTSAIYPLKRELEYTVLGLCSEVGELGEAYADGKRDKWGFSAEVKKELLSELADCGWYAAAIADALKTPLQEIFNRYSPESRHRHSRGLAILEVVACASNMAGIVKKSIRDNDGYLSDSGEERIKEELGKTLTLLAEISGMFGSTIEAITSANLNKLADRKARGVLAGSGNNR